MKFLFKAKKFPVGTIRKRKSGRWIKDKPGHWHMLREIVRDRHNLDGVHSNDQSARMMQRAARSLARHLIEHRGEFNAELAHRFLDREYGHLGYRRFGLWKKRVIEAVNKYIANVRAAYTGGAGREPSGVLKDIQKWKAALTEANAELKTDVERDEWVAKQFEHRKRPIRHLLYACREMIGKDTPLSMVPDSGFRGLCKAIIEKAYEHGPSGFSKDELERYTKAFDSVFKKPASEEGAEKPIPLARALALAHTKPIFRQHPKWFVYCVTRMAAKNEGHVLMSEIPKYIENARRAHGTKNPPAVDYDDPAGMLRSQVRLGLLSPAKALKRMQSSRKAPMVAKRRIYLKFKRSGK